MKRKIITNLLIILLLLAGVAVLLYPTASNWLASRNHSKAIQEYTFTVDQLSHQQLQNHLSRAEAYNRSLSDVPIADAFIPGRNMSMPNEYTSILNISGIIGYIDIPTIDIHIPIYHLTSEEILLKGIGHMDATAFPIGGKGNHSVLTGHRGLSSARLFTDLDKLEDGDFFYIHILEKTLRYQVDQITVVLPDETELLRPVPGEDLITLVTCTPYAINSHRLLVRGTRTEIDLEEVPLPEAQKSASAFWWMIAAVLFLLTTLLLFLWRRSKRLKE